MGSAGEEKQHQKNRREMLIEGDVRKVIPRLAVPTIISMMISAIYNMADTFFVSQLGTSASGAVGIIFSAMAIIQAIAFTIGMGSGNKYGALSWRRRSERGRDCCLNGIFYGTDYRNCAWHFLPVSDR